MMKKPIIKKEKGFFTETHFCPMCNKPTNKYCLEKENDIFYITNIETDGFIYFSEDNLRIEIRFIPFNALPDDENICYFDEDELIYFTFKELGIMDDFQKKISNIIGLFYKEYVAKYKCGGNENRIPYFCSNECVKKFIISEIKKRGETKDGKRTKD